MEKFLKMLNGSAGTFAWRCVEFIVSLVILGLVGVVVIKADERYIQKSTAAEQHDAIKREFNSSVEQLSEQLKVMRAEQREDCKEIRALIMRQIQ